MEKPLKIRLHVLSPIHIGCDDVYEPTSFVINPDKKELIAFDPFIFVKTLSDEEKKELLKITEKGTLASIIETYRFVFSKRSRITGWNVALAAEIVERYLAVKNMTLNENRIKQELNNFVIPRTVYNPLNNMPYIPGSSLKGSLRTGYLSMLALGGGDHEGLKSVLSGSEPTSPITNRTRASELERDLLKGTFAEDPFRLLKVSDLLPSQGIKTKIIYAVNQKKYKADLGRGIPQILEVVLAESVFEGTITIETPVNGTGIKEPIERGLLIAASNKHYTRVFNNENNIAKKLMFHMPAVNTMINEIKNKTGKRPFLIRIGRHSGAEAVTIEGNREIKIRGRSGESKINNMGATTIWLASEKSKPETGNALMPFGWSLVEFI